MNYSISLCGFNSKLIIVPLISIRTHLEKIVLLTTSDVRSLRTFDEVSKFASYIHIQTERVDIKNIYDFYEISLYLEILKRRYEKPQWLNVSAGPGIAISAFTIFGIANGISVVSYNSDQDTTSLIDVMRFKYFIDYIDKNRKILEVLKNGPKTLGEIAVLLQLSKSTISRKVKLFNEMSIVKTKKLSQEMVVSLTTGGFEFVNN